MKLKIFFFFIVFVISSDLLYAQERAIANALNKNLNHPLSAEIKADKKKTIKLWKGWSTGMNFGVTKFKGDITKYDHYPSYQKKGDFLELKTAMSFNLEKRINSLYSLNTELIVGKFAGLRRANDYSGYSVFDPFSGNYEGNGDKFVASFTEVDLLVNINLTNFISYFSKSKKGKKINFISKLGVGYNIFNSVRRNLISDTYINSFGYSDVGSNLNSLDLGFGNTKKPLFAQSTTTVYIYGIRVNYKLNARMKLNFDYTIRNAVTDKWDASIMRSQNTADKFAFLSIGLSYSIGDNDYNDDWSSPIDILKDDVSSLNIIIEGFVDDTDNDGVADAFDRSPNTPLGVAVDGAGDALDVDMDNVPDYRDADPFSNIGALVDLNGLEVDDDNDGVPNSKDLESNTDLGVMVNKFGITVSSIPSFIGADIIYFPSIYFNSGSSIVGDSNKHRIATIALLLKNNQHINLNVIGHTDNLGNAKFNKELGLKRANEVVNYLVLNYNINASRFSVKTKGEGDSLSSIKIIDSGVLGSIHHPLHEINRRVDFKIKK